MQRGGRGEAEGKQRGSRGEAEGKVLTKLSEYDKINLIRELNRMVRKHVKTGSGSEYHTVVNKFLNKYIDMGVIEWLK